jgi:hypothetical protein
LSEEAQKENFEVSDEEEEEEEETKEPKVEKEVIKKLAGSNENWIKKNFQIIFYIFLPILILLSSKIVHDI